MVKDIYVWELSDNNNKVVVKHFRHLERNIAGIQTIARSIAEVANNSKTDTNKVLISNKVPRRDNLNGKCLQVIILLKKLCMENDFFYVNHDNIKPRQRCNYGEIHLNTLRSKILANNFILALNTLTWHKISQENDALGKINPEAESNSKFLNNLPQDTLEGKGQTHRNFENLYFSFLRKTRKFNNIQTS